MSSSVRVSKGLKTTAANRKLAIDKLSLALTKLVQDELMPAPQKPRVLKMALTKMTIMLGY